MAAGGEQSGPRPAGRRGALRLGLLLLAVVSVSIGAWVYSTRTRAPSPAEGDASAGAPPTPPVAAAPPGASAAPAAPPSAGVPPPPPPPDDPVADYRRRTRYSPSSGVLRPEAVDLIEPNRRYESFRPIAGSADDGEESIVRYLFDADHYYYASDQTVTATLRVTRGGVPIPVRITRARSVAESGRGTEGDGEPLSFVPRNGSHELVTTPEDLHPGHHGPIQLIVQFEYAPGRSEEVTLRLFSTPVDAIPARFTNRLFDRMVNGSLVVEAGIQVDAAGFYRLDANLFGPDGAPLAFSSWKGDLEPGPQRVPLEFFGLLMSDLGVAGPYELRNLRGYLFLDGEHPDRLRMRDLEGSYWTHAYEVASFSEEEYTSPQKERMLELLEQDVRAGLGIDRPGVASR